MSETTLETPPLAPEEAPKAEPTASDNPTQEAPEWSKVLQKEQQKRANFEKQVAAQFDELKELIKSGASARQVEAKADRLDSILAKGRDLEQYVPGIGDTLAELAEEVKELRSKGGSDEKVAALEARLEQQQAYDRFMAGKPEGFKEAYEAEQQACREDAREDGYEVTDDQLSAHMGRWSKTWLKDNGKAAPRAKPAGSSRIIPAQAGARQTAQQRSPMEVLREGKDGNLLGVEL